MYSTSKIDYGAAIGARNSVDLSVPWAIVTGWVN